MLPNFPPHNKSFAPQCTAGHKKTSKWLHEATAASDSGKNATLRKQGNLFRGIDIWSGAAYKGLKSPFENSFVTFGLDP
jgi:hypothetical protein